MHETRATKYIAKGRVVLFSSRLHSWQLKKQLWNHGTGDEPVKWLLLRKLTCILLPFQLLWLPVNKARKVQLSAAKSEMYYCQHEENFQVFLTISQSSFHWCLGVLESWPGSKLKTPQETEEGRAKIISLLVHISTTTAQKRWHRKRTAVAVIPTWVSKLNPDDKSLQLIC